MKSSSVRTFCLVGISCLVVRAASPSFTMDYGAHKSTTLSSPSLVPASDTGTFTYYKFPVTNCAEKIECVSGVSTNGASVFHPIQVSFDVTGTKCELIVNNIVDFSTGTSSLAIAFWELTDGQTTSAFDSCVLGNSDFTTQYIPVTFAANTTHHLLFSIHGNFGGVNVTGGNTVSHHHLSPKPNLLVVLGDSYTEGSVPYSVMGEWPSYFFAGWVWQLAWMNTNLKTTFGAAWSSTGAVKHPPATRAFVHNVTGVAHTLDGRVVPASLLSPFKKDRAGHVGVCVMAAENGTRSLGTYLPAGK